jgi:hypothetical protein
MVHFAGNSARVAGNLDRGASLTLYLAYFYSPTLDDSGVTHAPTTC